MNEPSRALDLLVRGLAEEAGIRLLAVDVTAAADETRVRHGLSPQAASLAAQGLVAAQLMSSSIKGEERITLQLQAEEPRFALVVDVNSDGTTRARFTPEHVPDAEAIQGVILVIKHDARREIYRGLAPVEETTFQGALQSYLEHSQQTSGVVRIQVQVGQEGSVKRAMGIMVEKLPDQDEGVFRDLFGDLATSPIEPVLEEIHGQGSLWGFPITAMEVRSLAFHCPCSPERARDLLAGLGAEEVREILEEQGGAELTCSFCRERYHLDRVAVEQLLEEIEGRR